MRGNHHSNILPTLNESTGCHMVFNMSPVTLGQMCMFLLVHTMILWNDKVTLNWFKENNVLANSVFEYKVYKSRLCKTHII